MARENQLLLDDGREIYYCYPCQRHFRSRNGAISHATSANVHRDEWCYRCEWLFVSEDALDDHLDSSKQHQACEVCSDTEDLQEHMRHNHYCCNTCGAGFGNEHALYLHEQYRECDQSDDYESSQSDASHASAAYRTHYGPECHICSRDFDRVSQIVQHLEGATCESGVNSDYIRETALRFDRRGTLTDYRDRTYPFRCPECSDTFRFISGLLQHIEGRSCRQTMDPDVCEILDVIQDRLGWRW